ncbi:MFS transporter [Dactylosporangium sp. NPDC051541]|uniref:MFS transporter n=1 Tax=Dactylosporangium sp. NPDC051541 TaxID=3363977 RepID=UPI00378F9F70
MSVIRGVAQTVVTTARAARVATVGTTRAGRYLGRNLLRVRERGAGGEAGMLRLLDLHAASCAGDALVTLGLAGTVFFSVPAGEARGRVALYLLITMLPFALLAPVIGPLLDRFRHGRRYALAVTMLGRAALAFLLSDHLSSWLLYPAAFGMLVLSRAYGVARSAAVPRVLPPGLGLSEAGARASVFGTIAGAIALPLGLLAGQWGPQWPLRLSILVFVFGMVTALRLPARADSDPPETVPGVLRRSLGRRQVKVLSGRVVVSALIGSATLRALYGFLTLYLAFAIKEGTLPVGFLAWQLSQQAAVVVAAGALGVGTFLATAIGTRLRIHRPAQLQAIGLVMVAFVAVLAADRNSLATVALLCLFTAVASGLAKLAVDASIQERIDENVRASAFAHSETLLMIAWVLGGAVGLVPFGSSWGLILAAGFVTLGAVRALYSAVVLRKERLRGAPADVPDAEGTTVVTPARQASSTTTTGASTSTTAAGAGAGGASEAPTVPRPAQAAEQGERRRFGFGRRGERATETASAPTAPGGGSAPPPSTAPSPSAAPPPAGGPTETRRMPAVDVEDGSPLAPPGYTLYRPSGTDPTARLEDDER